MNVECYYKDRCKHRGKSTACETCENNHLRNMEQDLYKKANDNPIPDECPRLHYDGPAEQTAGYKCPVCGYHTNPYSMRDKRCNGCGYLLNV